MFTGIVEGQGEVADLALGPGGARLRVRAPWLDGLRLGDSVSVNGCCLTVTDLEPDGFTADVMAESWRRTAIGRIGLDPELARYVVAKGSITVNGVSLTVVEAGPDWLTVALIPHTMAVTNLGRLAAGDEVQLEVDVLAKYVERLLAPRLATGERGRA